MYKSTVRSTGLREHLWLSFGMKDSKRGKLELEFSGWSQSQQRRLKDAHLDRIYASGMRTISNLTTAT